MRQADMLRFAIDAFEQIGLTYMVVGSFASGAYGEPRFTQDIDIVIDLPERLVKPLCAAFPDSDFYISESAALQAARQRVPMNVLHPASGNKIDLMPVRDDEWGRSQLQRRQRILLLPDREGYTARPEDVIIGKLWYYSEGGSEKHLRDITGILRLCTEPIDRDDIAAWAAKLGYTEIWQAVLSRLGETSQS